MSKASRLADQYERRYPGTGVSEPQAAERMERMQRKEDPHRHGGRKSILIPELPWMTTTKEGQ